MKWSKGQINISFPYSIMEIFLSALAIIMLMGIVIGILVLKHIYQLPHKKQDANPQRLKLSFRTVKIPVGSGYNLTAWYFPASIEPGSAVVLLHGWGQTAESLYPLITPLHQAGLNVFIFDARNHGMSDGEGRPSLRQFAEDLKSALDWLAKQSKVQADQLFIIGHSIGGAAALLVASSDVHVTGVISISSFSHSVNHFCRVFRDWHIPYWPLGWAIIQYRQMRQGFSFDQLAPVNTIGEISIPVLLIHARDDTATPLSDAQAIYEQRRDENVQLLILPGGGHYPIRALKKSSKTIIDFINSCPSDLSLPLR